MAIKSASYKAFTQWYKGLKIESDGFPPRGAIGSAYILLERLRVVPDLDISSHRAAKGTQLQGASPAALQKFLESRHSIKKRFVGDGIRTNRGNIPNCETLLKALDNAGFDAVTDDERNSVIDDCQLFLADRIKDWFQKQIFDVDFDLGLSTESNIYSIFSTAGERGRAGEVAQHLVGAKLQIRFPDISIGKESATTADVQLGRRGDFEINSSVFHVTVAPKEDLIRKCTENLSEGYRVRLLVPDEKLAMTHGLVEQNADPKRITVSSIEAFISENIDEISMFDSAKLKDVFRRLIEVYNERIEEVEVDKSLKIKIPEHL